MRAHFEKLTITLDKPIAEWARSEAAREKTSVSRFIEGILQPIVMEQLDYQSAMRRTLARKPFLSSDERHMAGRKAVRRRTPLSE